MTGSTAIERAGERLVLLPERAVWWPAAGTLFVADTHFGKDSAFRAASIPLPTGVVEADLERLGRVIASTGAARLVVLGDFFHAKSGRSAPVAAALDAWRRLHAGLDLAIVRGNHDLHAGDVPPEWKALVVNEGLVDGPFVLAHEPVEHAGGYVMAGHVHPGVRLRGSAAERLVLPCFRFGAAVATLPAFGSFTGLKIIRPSAEDDVFVVADDAVHAVPTA